MQILALENLVSLALTRLLDLCGKRLCGYSSRKRRDVMRPFAVLDAQMRSVRDALADSVKMSTCLLETGALIGLETESVVAARVLCSRRWLWKHLSMSSWFHHKNTRPASPTDEVYGQPEKTKISVRTSIDLQLAQHCPW